MKISLVSVLLYCVFCTSTAAQYVRLSEDAQISVLTMGPDKDELYSAFGHNAIRVYDPTLGIDRAYNYGTFNYEDPNFYINFTKGYLAYFLSTSDYSRLHRYYEYFDRWMTEQVLDLTASQKQAVFEYLETNAQPENATYFYDYFYDNCATRVRDVFKDVLQDDVRFDPQYVEGGMTVRELTDIYLVGKFPWGDLGIDICLGMPMDKTMDSWQYMFLPDYIYSGFEAATIVRDEKMIPLVKSSARVLTSSSEPTATLFSPLVVFSGFLVIGLILTWLWWRVGKRGRGLDVLLFASTGAIGLLLTALWFLTDHNAAANNLNILWAFPVNVVGVYSLFRNGRLRVGYFRFLGWASLVLLLCWNFLPQDLHDSLIPIAMLILVRSFYIGYSYAYNAHKI